MKLLYGQRATLSIVLISLTWACNDVSSKKNLGSDEKAIRQIHNKYVTGWLTMNEDQVMNLFEENAQIQPNQLKPIQGRAAIRKFWFPQDSSKTIINDYKTELVNIHVSDTLAITTHTSSLDWTYQKDTLTFGKFQKGINTTIYRKHPDQSWKIWRSMWTDIYARSK